MPEEKGKTAQLPDTTETPAVTSICIANAAENELEKQLTGVVTQVVEHILMSNLEQAKEVALQLQEIAKLLQQENCLLKTENAKLKGENTEIKNENKELLERMASVIAKIESMHENFKSATAQLPEFIRQSPEFKVFAEKQHKEFAELKALAYSDKLTGLSNRHHLTQIAGTKHGNYVGFCVDIDHFKNINDTMGHDVGDQVLKDVGKIIRETCGGEHGREMYTFRLGGEEIGVLVRTRGGVENEQTELAYVTSVAEKIRANIEDNGRCTVSIGVSDKVTKLPDKDVNFKETFGDKNLYTAKQTGRNKVVSPVKVERVEKEQDIMHVQNMGMSR
jgi:diguanylate cyclase (GGDEF)-like protein